MSQDKGFLPKQKLLFPCAKSKANAEKIRTKLSLELIPVPEKENKSKRIKINNIPLLPNIYTSLFDNLRHLSLVSVKYGR